MTQGKVARIDDGDWPLVEPYRWYASRTKWGDWYACARPIGGSRGATKLKMHNLIMGRKWIDHKNGDGLDNRRSNLRPCTNAENQQNAAGRGGTSRYKGVSWYARHGKWRVAFSWQGKTHFVGYFDDELEAALAYDAAILPLAGEFARTNLGCAPPRLRPAPPPMRQGMWQRSGREVMPKEGETAYNVGITPRGGVEAVRHKF